MKAWMIGFAASALAAVISGSSFAQDGPTAVVPQDPAAGVVAPVPSTGDVSGAAPIVVPGPTVVVSAPTAGEVLGGLVQLQASAKGALAVQFVVDGTPFGAPMTTPPYMATWNTRFAADGDHVVSATAIDQSGAQAISPGLTVTVRNAMRAAAPPPPPPPPAPAPKPAPPRRAGH